MERAETPTEPKKGLSQTYLGDGRHLTTRTYLPLVTRRQALALMPPEYTTKSSAVVYGACMRSTRS
jgi:hypothetical protein